MKVLDPSLGCLLSAFVGEEIEAICAEVCSEFVREDATCVLDEMEAERMMACVTGEPNPYPTPESAKDVSPETMESLRTQFWSMMRSSLLFM